MKISTRGQVTVPRHILERLGFHLHTSVEWKVRDGMAVLRKAASPEGQDGWTLVEHMRGRGSVRMTTDEIMALVRGTD